MVMDLTEPIPAISPSRWPSPERLLKLAIVVGTAGVIALIVAVIVLVWTVSGVSAPVVSQQASMPADIAVKQPVPAAPAAALVPEPAPAPAPAETLAPAAPAAAPAAGSNSEILGNPAMAAIAPTAPAPASDVAPTVNLPTVTLPNGDLNGLDWNDLNSNLQNAAASYLWQNSGADATTGAIVGAVSGIGNNALGIVGNNAGNLVTTLILANLGFYGTTNPLYGQMGNALSQIGVGVPSVPSLGVPSLSTSIGIPGTPIGTQIGPPQLPQIGPPQLPSLPRPGFAIPGTPIGVGF
jgi:hypothetical protein